MARRGLVSKNFGPSSDGGKPPHGMGQKGAPGGGKTPTALSLDQVAAQLKVSKDQVKTWVKDGLLRSSSAGIRPYDFNKFKLDCADEIQKARQRPKAVPKVEKKPQKKSIFASFFSLFSGGDSDDGDSGPSKSAGRKSSREVNKLQGQLKEANNRIRSLQKKLDEMQESGAEPGVTDAEAPTVNVAKIQKMEAELARIPQLEAELARARESSSDDARLQEAEAQLQMLEVQLAQAEGLRRESHQRIQLLEAQLEQSGSSAESGSNPARVAELEETVAQLQEQLQQAQAQRQNQAQEASMDAVSAQRLADLEHYVQQIQPELEQLDATIAQREQELRDLRAEASNRLGEQEQRIQELESQLAAAEIQAAPPPEGEQAQHILELRQALAQSQEYNERAFEKFQESEAQRLELLERCEALEDQLANSRPSDASEGSESEVARLQQELQQARAETAHVKGVFQQAQTNLEQVHGENESLKTLLEQQQQRLNEMQRIAGETSTELEAELQNALHELKLRDQLIEKLESQAPAPASEPAPEQLKELEELRQAVDRQKIQIHRLEAQLQDSGGGPDQAELVDQLASTRVELNSLRRSNEVVRLAKARLESQVQELRSKLDEQGSGAPPSSLSLLTPTAPLEPDRGEVQKLKRQLEQTSEEKVSLENEVRSLRDELRLQKAREATSQESIAHQQIAHLQRTVSARDSQVKKLAAKLAEMERALSKAHQESTRLTEHLMDRESRLKEIQETSERRLEETLKNMERQVTGLEWKLSLREDRIAALEQELARGNRVLPPPPPRQA